MNMHWRCLPRLDAVTAPRATVGTVHGLNALRDASVLARAKGRDLQESRRQNRPFSRQHTKNRAWVGSTYTGKSNTAVTALGRSSRLFEVVVDELAARGLYDSPTV